MLDPALNNAPVALLRFTRTVAIPFRVPKPIQRSDPYGIKIPILMVELSSLE